MGYNTRKKSNSDVIAAIIIIIALIADIILVFALKGKSPKFRWLWLPLISLALACVIGGSGALFEKNSGVGKAFSFISIVWGIIRGIIVVVAHFKSASGFWAVVGAIFLCIFIFVFNSFSFIIGGNIMKDDDGSTPAPREPKRHKDRKSEWNYNHREESSYKTSYTPSTGDLSKYFNSYCCAPQVGSMYFWDSYPSMSGGGSSYTISGTLGIKKQSVDAFHVSYTDMDHYSRSVVREIDNYAEQIVNEYRHDYPDDTTDFHISVNIDVMVTG